METSMKSCRGWVVIVLGMGFVACGGGGGAAPPVMSFTVGGMVAGLSGSGLSLKNNGGDDVAIAASGAFTFARAVQDGAAYSVTVATQPSAPAQNCVVTNGSGTLRDANVTNVSVTCTVVPPFTILKNQPPEIGYLSLLLTDGSVMMQSANDASAFYNLMPASDGGYVNGTWRKLASPPAGYAPADGSQAVLADGRVLFVGGEYNQNQYQLPFAPSGLTNMSAIYDPVADTWTMIAPPPGVAYIGDSPSAVLPDGSFVLGRKLGRDMWRLDPVNLTWVSVPAVGKADDFAEEGWTLLPDGELFTIDVETPPHAEHYDPIASQWYGDGNTPMGLTSPGSAPGGLSYGPAPLEVVGGVTYGPGPKGTYFPPGEIGPALLLPDGRVFATGAAANGAVAHTVLYTPSATPAGTGSFAAGPDFASGDDADDSSGALLPSGHVLIATASGRFYEFDGTTMPVTGVLTNDRGNTVYFLLPLPNGQVLVTGGVTQFYAAAGSADPAWAPTITAGPSSVMRGSSYLISGTQFNGMSQAAAVGDELNAATNYPLVRITNATSGHVVYARTHGHSSMGVATGSTIISTHFDVPAGTETGLSLLQVVANGIASAQVSLTVN
jgi:hypothetical protein